MYSYDIENFKGFYTGVGSRETPLYIMYMFSQLSMIFAKQGYVLRSGCAIGADAAFEDGIIDKFATEIYIPNATFPYKMGTNMKNSYIIPQEKFGKTFNSLYREAMRMIEEKAIHKGWINCKAYVKDLHNRNIFQTLGLDLKTKSKFTLCYTKNGEKKYKDTDWNTGGTATAINASDLNNIEVFNMANNEDYNRLSKYIEKHKNLIEYEIINKIRPRSDFNNNKMTYEELMPIIIKEKNSREKNNKSKKLGYIK